MSKKNHHTFKQNTHYYSLTNFYLGLARGPIDHNASSVINVIADDVIEMGSAVKLVTPIASELLPRVTEVTAFTDVNYGIAVGGDTDGIYSPTGTPGENGVNTTAATAGEGVVIVTQGRCLARVDGSAGPILVGTELAASNDFNGTLQTADETTQHVIARALQPSSALNDIIAIDVQREGRND